MQDRVSTYPGRVTLTPVAGQENTFDMVRADDPVVVGTPLNKETLLQDSTAELFGFTSPSGTTVDDVLGFAGEKINDAVYVYTRPTQTLGDMEIGEEFSVPVSGDETPFILISKDYNGTGRCLVMSKYVFGSTQWAGAATEYKHSDVYRYMGNTFYNMIDESVREQITSIGVPTNGENISVSVFALSATEMGTTTSPAEGTAIPYFSSAAERQAYSASGTPTGYWLRTANGGQYPYECYPNGSVNTQGFSATLATRPCFTLPADFEAIPSKTIIADMNGNPVSIPASQVVGAAKVASGSYTGTNKSGSSNPCKLTFDFDVKAFIVTTSDTMGFVGTRVWRTSTSTNTIGHNVTVTSMGKTVSWYADDAIRQGNYPQTYNYVAWG